PDDYGTWKSLGLAWNTPRAEYPRGETVPAYIPVFSDGWLPPPLDKVLQQGESGCGTPPGCPTSCLSFPNSFSTPTPLSLSPHTGTAHQPEGRSRPGRQVRALYDFQGRNPQELSIRMGDTLQVLDQQKKWWLVEDSRGQRGYVPGNVLESLEQGHGERHSISQETPPSLLPDSPPEEVAAWLKDKGFSRM
ncbi:ES8L3 protein, partial [Ramphastos sulfuratus]|nr:ES8L3 protein [Ramphastos sulfuratus]